MNHLRAVLIWAGLCSALLVAALIMRELPPSGKGLAILVMMALVNFGLIVKICRGHK